MVPCSSLGLEAVWVAEMGAGDTPGAELIFHRFAGEGVSDLAQGNQPWLWGAGGLSHDPLSCPPRLSYWRATTGNAA